MKRGTAVLLFAVLAVAAACSSDEDGAVSTATTTATATETTDVAPTTEAPSTTAPATTEAPATSDAAVTTEPEAVTVGEWQAIPGGGQVPFTYYSYGNPQQQGKELAEIKKLLQQLLEQMNAPQAE